MGILKQIKQKYSKQISVLLAVLMMLSPIISSASTLLMSESIMPHHSISVSTESDVEQMKSASDRDSCHETSAQAVKNSTKMTTSSVTNDCCDESCLCAQAGCQSSSAAFHNSALSVSTDRAAFNFTAPFYLNPQTLPSFPPPIS
ncbi:hypothetical protein A3755_19715 [Oleiphilus sp. HI0085]|nr:hypothetical protein A3735_01295 [Oleiphilus sp. HI0061]KZY87632.1 hypothetical protein A3741_01835 [Oleiphilus sp. HI0069]KZZ45733.1 hypothetical protein A3755_19715 [Oleiphilus sp. HI0085]